MPMRIAVAVALLLIGRGSPGSAFAETADRGVLVKVVVVSRHGVRAPLNKPEELALWSDRDWPDLAADWKVSKPGSLTPVGSALARLMGEYYRALLASENLLPARGCPSVNSLFVRADVDPRTLDTAAALLEGLVGRCPGFSIHSLDAGIDPLFHPVEARVCAFDRGQTEAAILGRIGSDFGPVQQAAGDELQTLQGILGCCRPELCKRFGKAEGCTLQALGSGLAWREPADPKKENATFSLEGTLGVASTAAEVFLVEYASGFKGEKWGFGRVDEARMLQTSRLHTLLFDIVDRTPYVAKREGSQLLDRVARILLSERGFKLPKMPGDARAVFLVGHDTNIANLAAMLDVSWQQTDYQLNDTPPAGALVFELRRGADGRLRVFTSYIAQSPGQMAEMRPLDLDHPPRRTALFLPACSSRDPGYPCSANAFARAVELSLDRRCLGPAGR